MSTEVAGQIFDKTQPTAQAKYGLSRIGKYQVLPAAVGDGGFCSVYKCKYRSSQAGTVTVAVKLGTYPMSSYDHVKWEAHRKEWQTYQSLAFGRTTESHSAGIPAVYECGLVKTKLGIHTWISMQLLGPDLRTLAAKGYITLQADFLHLANAMLAAVQYVHDRGIVHNDIKPANFCIGRDSEADKVFIVDFGFASHVPSKERARLDRTYCQVAFAGTPDYASRDALRGVRCSPKDDLESLGYCWLELLCGDLPWYLTHEKPFEGPNCFSHEQLCQMADAREAYWEQLCDTEQIPAFLVSWHQHVRSLSMYQTPSYDKLRRLLQHAPIPEPHKFKRSEDASAEDVKATKKQKIDHCAPEE